MKEALGVACDEKWDGGASDFEMVVGTSITQMVRTHIVLFHREGQEPTDLFSDLVKLKMWGPSRSFLTSQNSSDKIEVQALWIIDSAIQNNPSAQNFVRVSLRHALNSRVDCNLR